MIRAEAVRDTARDHRDGIHHIDQGDGIRYIVQRSVPFSGREKHLESYASYRLQRRREEKINSFAGSVLSILLVLTMTQVSFQRDGSAVNGLDIAPSELIIDEFIELVYMPPSPPPVPSAAPEASSRPEATNQLATEAIAANSEAPRETPAETEATEAQTEHAPSRAVDLVPLPAIDPQAVELVDSSALTASSIRIRPVPEMPNSDGLDRPPQLIVESMYLRYPWDALKREKQGLVVLHFFVDARGRTSSVRILSSTCPPCEESAVKAVQRARFRPGRQNGQNVGTFTRLAIRFVLR